MSQYGKILNLIRFTKKIQNTEYNSVQNTTSGVLGGVQQRLLSELHQGGLLLPQTDRVHEEVILNLNKT